MLKFLFGEGNYTMIAIGIGMWLMCQNIICRKTARSQLVLSSTCSLLLGFYFPLRQFNEHFKCLPTFPLTQFLFLPTHTLKFSLWYTWQLQIQTQRTRSFMLPLKARKDFPLTFCFNSGLVCAHSHAPLSPPTLSEGSQTFGNPFLQMASLWKQLLRLFLKEVIFTGTRS